MLELQEVEEANNLIQFIWLEAEEEVPLKLYLTKTEEAEEGVMVMVMVMDRTKISSKEGEDVAEEETKDM